MFDNNLRGMIDDVKDGRVIRRAFMQAYDCSGRPHRADGEPNPQPCRRRGDGAKPQPGLQTDQARRRRSAEGSCGGRARPFSIRTSPPAPRTRTARASSTSRWRAGTFDGNLRPKLAAEHPRAARTVSLSADGRVGDLEAETGRQMARRQAAQRRRRRLHLGVFQQPRDGDCHQSAPTRHVAVEKIDKFSVLREVPEADAVLGRHFRRLGGLYHS